MEWEMGVGVGWLGCNQLPPSPPPRVCIAQRAYFVVCLHPHTLYMHARR